MDGDIRASPLDVTAADVLDLDEDEVHEESKEGDKFHTFMILLYPGTETYDFDSVLVGACEYCEKWAYILHDCDLNADGTVKKPHYHLVANFTNARSIKSLANQIGIPPNYIKCRRKYTWKKAVRYLAHLDQPKKARYDPGLITANCDISAIIDPMDDVAQARAIFEYLVEYGVSNPVTLSKWAFEQGCYSELRRGYPLWRDILKFQANYSKNEGE